MEQLILPNQLEPFRLQLEASARKFVKIHAGQEASLKPWQSKVGGQPYLEKGNTLPSSEEGKPLFFLAQINFSEVPPFESFPEKGIVQFFIGDDDLYGMDFDDGENQDKFRVIFHENPVEDESRLEAVKPTQDDEDLLPHHPEQSFPLRFSIETEYAPTCDYNFWQLYGQDFFEQFGENDWEVSNAYNQALKPAGHKLGGYAYFTQDDPRRPEDPMLLLFQLDSDEGMDLMWGDMGVGHFFIRESDLLNKDFSRVLYDWDCL